MPSKLFILVTLLLFVVINSSSAQQLLITSPINGDTFKEGDTVNFVAELTSASLGQIIWVSLLASSDSFMGEQPKLEPGCIHIQTHPKYSCKFTIPHDTKTITLSAIGKTPAGAITSQAVIINVALPANVVLQELKTDGTIFLYGTSGPGSQDGLLIVGRYSDGVDRDLRNRNTGTKYFTSNPGIITVDADGLVTAHSLGKAQITVINGDKKITINAIVKESLNLK